MVPVVPEKDMFEECELHTEDGRKSEPAYTISSVMSPTAQVS